MSEPRREDIELASHAVKGSRPETLRTLSWFYHHAGQIAKGSAALVGLAVLGGVGYFARGTLSGERKTDVVIPEIDVKARSLAVKESVSVVAKSEDLAVVSTETKTHALHNAINDVSNSQIADGEIDFSDETHPDETVLPISSVASAGNNAFPALSLSNTNTTTWLKTFSISGYDFTSRSVAPAMDGGYIAVGQTTLLKLDSFGGIVWAKRFDYVDDPYLSVQPTTDSGYIASCNIGGASIQKLDSAGNQLWTKKLDGTIYSIQQTTDGGYIAVAYISSIARVLKLDGAGNKVWAKEIGTSSYNIYMIQPTLDGGYATCYYVCYPCSYKFIKLDSVGNTVWAKTFSTQYLYSFQPINDGYIVAGKTYASSQFLVFKLNTTGSVIWAKTFGDKQGEANSVQQTTNGGYIAAGGYYGYPLIIKLDSFGNKVWAKTSTWGGAQEFDKVHQTADEGYVAVATFYSGNDHGLQILKFDANGNNCDAQGISGQVSDVVSTYADYSVSVQNTTLTLNSTSALNFVDVSSTNTTVCSQTFPVVNLNLAIQTQSFCCAASIAQFYNFTFAADTFIGREDESFSYTSTRADSTSLPAWLAFNASTRTFTGTPLSGNDIGIIGIKVTASNPEGENASDIFALNVANTLRVKNVNVTMAYTQAVTEYFLDIVATTPSNTLTTLLTLSDPAAGYLTTGASGGVNATYNSTTGVWEASGNAIDVSTILATVIYQSTQNSTKEFSIAVHMIDGYGQPVDSAVNVVPVDKMWIKALTGGTPGLIQQQTTVGQFIWLGSNLIFKLDSVGNRIWAKMLTGGGIVSVAQTMDGGYVAAGYIVVSSDGSSYKNALVFKFNITGDILWASKLWRSNVPDWATVTVNNIQPTSDGGCVTSGYFVVNGGNTAFTLKLDASGNTVWMKSVLAGGWDVDSQATYVQQTSDGGYIVTGYVDLLGPRKIFVNRLDGSGNGVWKTDIQIPSTGTTGYSIKGTSTAYAVQPTADGGGVVAGDTLVKYSGTYSYVKRALVFKLDNCGAITWITTFGKSGKDYSASFVQPTSDGGYIVGGSLVLKLNSTGGLMWAKSLSGSVQQTFDGGYVVGMGNSIVKLDATGRDCQGQDLPWNVTNAIFYTEGCFPGSSSTPNVTINSTPVSTLSLTNEDSTTTLVCSQVFPHTNLAIQTQVSCCKVGIGQFYSFTFAADTFVGREGEVLTYDASKADGTALPVWLSFNSALRTLSGTPVDSSDIGDLSIKVTASDPSLASVSDTFTLQIAKTLSATNTHAPIGYTEDAQYSLTPMVITTPSIAITAQLTLSDLTIGSLSNGTSGSVTTTYNAATGVWQASGAKADVNALLAALKLNLTPYRRDAFSIAVRITDSYGQSLNDTISAVCAVPVNHAPLVINSIATQVSCCTAGIGQPYSFIFAGNTFTDPDGDTLTYNATKLDGTALPGWISFNPGTRTFSGTPANAGEVGDLAIKVTASDPSLAGVSDTFTLQIAKTLSATNTHAPIGYTEDAQYSLTPMVITTPSSTITVQLTLSDLTIGSLSNGTSGSVTTTYNAATGVWQASGAKADVNTLLSALKLNLTPYRRDAFSIAVSITDNYGQSLNDMISAVCAVPVNHAPLVNNSIATQALCCSTGIGQPYSFIFAGNTFTDPDGDTLTYTATKSDGTALPVWISFNPGTRTFSGTPANAGEVGDLAINVTASDPSLAGVSDIFTLQIAKTLSATNTHAPIGYTEDAQYSLTPMVITTPSSTITVQLTLSDPTIGSLSIGSSGSVTATYNAATGVWQASGAKADVNALLAALKLNLTLYRRDAFSIAVRITDSYGQSINDTISAVCAVPVNHAPLVINSIATQVSCCTAGIGQPYSFIFAGNTFTDPDGDTLTYNATKLDGTALPVWISFNSGTRTFSGTPANAGEIGDLAIKVTANDPSLASVSDTFTLKIAKTLSATNLASIINYIENTVYNLTPIVITTPSAIVTAQLTLSDITAGSLTTATSGSVTSTYDSTTGVWGASGNTADVNTLLAGLKYQPAADYNAGFSISVNITDSYEQNLSSTLIAPAPKKDEGLKPASDSSDLAVIIGISGGAVALFCLSWLIKKEMTMRSWRKKHPLSNLLRTALALDVRDFGSGKDGGLEPIIDLLIEELRAAQGIDVSRLTPNELQELSGSLAMAIRQNTTLSRKGCCLFRSNALDCMDVQCKISIIAQDAAKIWWTTTRPMVVQMQDLAATASVVTSDAIVVCVPKTPIAMPVMASLSVPLFATNIASTIVYTEGAEYNLTPIVVTTSSDTVIVRLTLNDPSAGRLTTGTSNSVTATYDTVTGVWQASGSKSDVNALLACLKYQPTVNYYGAFNIAVSISDGLGQSTSSTINAVGTTTKAVPQVNAGALLQNQITNIGQVYNFTFSSDTFINPSRSALTYTAARADGSALPSWITFNPATNTFSGTPVKDSDLENLNIKIVATDSNGASVSDTFTLNVAKTLCATNTDAAINYLENTEYSLAAIVITTPRPTVTARLTLSDKAAGSLTTATIGSVASTYDAATGVWETSGNKDDVNALLAALKYRPAEGYRESFNVIVSITDDSGQSLNSILRAPAPECSPRLAPEVLGPGLRL